MSGIGIGGGSILVLWLTTVTDIEPTEARFLSLLVFFPAAVISCIFRFRDISSGKSYLLCAIIPGAVSAGLFCVISSDWNTILLRKFFGGLLFVSGIRELVLSRKKTNSPK